MGKNDIIETNFNFALEGGLIGMIISYFKKEKKVKKVNYRIAMLLIGFLIVLANVLNIVLDVVSFKISFMLFMGWGIFTLVMYLMDESIDIRKRMKILMLVGLTILASLPSFISFVFYGHDISFHLNRLCAVAEELKNFQFPVRMQSTTLNGYGYATSLFYSDLFLYIPAALIAFGLPVYMSYNLYVISVTFFTILVSYLCFKSIFKNEKIAMVGSFTYTISIYRIINVYLRAAVGEYTAMIFLPLLLLGVWNFLEAKENITFQKYFPLVLGITGVLQCHILSCEMIAEFGLLFIVLNIRKFMHKEHILAICKTVLWCIGLNAFFLIPFLMSYGMDLEVKTRELTSVGPTSLFLMEYFNVFVKYYGESVGSEYIRDMSMGLGAALFIGIVVYIVFFMNRKRWELKSIKSYIYGKKLFFYAMIALFLTSSLFPWKSLHLLGKTIHHLLCQIQFAWRYLEIATVLLVTMNLCIIKVMLDKGWRKFAIVFVGLISCVSILTYTYYIAGVYTEGKTIPAMNYAEVGNDNCGWEEYVISGTDTKKTEKIIEPYTDKNNVKLRDYIMEKGVRSVYCKSEEATTVTFPIMNYDNYIAYDKSSGEKMKITTGENNAIQVVVPANYEGTIVIKYQEPIIWRISEIISVLTVLGMIVCFRRKKGDK